MTYKDVILEKWLLEKAVTKKRFEYSTLGKELKLQTDIAKKQCQGLEKICKFDETINTKPTLKKWKFYKYFILQITSWQKKNW